MTYSNVSISCFLLGLLAGGWIAVGFGIGTVVILASVLTVWNFVLMWRARP